jgi:hypothetical protein
MHLMRKIEAELRSVIGETGVRKTVVGKTFA